MNTKLTWNESKKVLKAALNKEFPGIKFSMKKRYYDTLDVSYVDTDISAEKVREITNTFEGKSFDGMNDLETYVKTGLAFGYIFVEREVTDSKKLEVFKNKIFGGTFDGVKIDMSFENFLNLNFYEEQYKKLRNWGLDPENMLYRFLTETN